jgi:C1A family cysteine protease
MMMYKFLFSVFLISFVQAKTLYPKKIQSSEHEENVEVITNSIFEELIKVTKDLELPEELRPKKESVNNMSRGKKMIEEMKRRNREKLAKMRGINPDKVKSGADIVKAQKEDNKNLIKAIQSKIKSESEWRQLAESEITKLKEKVISDWKEKHRQKIKKWEEEKKKYQNEKEKYQDTTFELPLILPVDKKEQKKALAIEIDRDYHIVSAAMSVAIRDQKFRPTCAAFAGVRLIEVLMAQNDKMSDLSEQYFYWASKDNCQKSPCANAGSWVGHGFEYSSNQKREDIPLEKNCPYVSYNKVGNETQIPLENTCSKGEVKIGDVKYLKNLDQVIKALKKNQAVVASMRLTPNYYTSSSLILYKDRNIGDRTDAHAQGHSMVIVGYVKLPKILNEGSVCFIVANSWGEGWGQGGHACISEKWMLEQRQVNPFVVLKSIEI